MSVFEKPNWRDYLPFAVISFILMILFHVYEWDLVLARRFYHHLSDGFYLRDNLILEKIFHKGGVKFTQTVLAIMFLRLIFLSIKKCRGQYSKILIRYTFSRDLFRSHLWISTTSTWGALLFT